MTDPRIGAFLVERYVSPAAASGLALSVAGLAQQCADARTDGVRYLQSAYLPADDTCFCLFSASTAHAVTAINERAGFAFDRITGAVILRPYHRPTPPDQRKSS